MSKETFDFSEALRRMKEGKKVKRKGVHFLYSIEDNEMYIHSLSTRTSLALSKIGCDNILATDWEEVEG